VEISIEDVVEALTKEYVSKLVKKLKTIFLSYIRATTNLYRQRYLVEPTLELNMREFEWGIEAHIRLYIDELEIAKIRNAIRKQLEDNRLKIKAYADIAKLRIKGSSVEMYDLLSGLRPSTTAGGGKIRIFGEEVRDQEGGSTAEGSQ
jgi:hypothetical protein